MKRFLCLWVLIGSLLITSCSDDNGPAPIPNTEKTLLLYMPWSSTAQEPYSNTLYPCFMENLASIERAIGQQGGLGSTRLLAFVSQSPTYSALVEIKYQGGTCLRDTLKRYEGHAYTSASGIASLLGDVRHYAEAPTYAMVIGSHGTGWIPRDVTNYYRSRAFGGVEPEFMTEISTLASGISQAGMTMQFIAFDDCYMAGIEVAYELRHAASHLIASTSEIMSEGLPYRQIWKYLSAQNPDYRAIVNEFYTYYSHFAYPYGTLSVIDCAQVDNMASLMTDFNHRYVFDESRLDQLQKLDGMRQTIFYDMGSYIDQLCDANDQAQFVLLVQRLVPYHAHTPKIWTDLSSYNGGFSTVAVNKFCGITISDPTTNTYVVGRKSMTAWWKATHD